MKFDIFVLEITFWIFSLYFFLYFVRYANSVPGFVFLFFMKRFMKF